MTEPDLIIVGGSVRAAAGSARRAGLRPWCADLYADLDTVALSAGGPPGPLRRYSDLRSLFRSAPDVPWMYTGCLENHPRLVAELADVRPLWGNDRDALAACRSPFRVAELLGKAGLPALQVRATADGLSEDRPWVCKPLRSCGGQGIKAVQGGGPPPPGRGHYLQEFARGTPMSAVFIRIDGRVERLGVTEQFVGAEWLNAAAFAYSGSIGPVRLPAPLDAQVTRIGEVIGRECGLRGLFGVDFVCADDRAWVVEVNPRYTASIEVLERVSGTSAVGRHCQAFDRNAPANTPAASAARWAAKAIVYAGRPLTVRHRGGLGNAIGLALASAADGGWPDLGDLPADGAQIGRRCPILSVFAAGPTRAVCVDRLRRRAEEVLTAFAD